MAFGDCLVKRLEEGYFLSANESKTSNEALWKKIVKVAIEDIKAISPKEVDGPIAIRLYYSIMLEHIDKIPEYYRKTLPSNSQERFRVAIRNAFSSNAFHPAGIANQPGIVAYKTDKLKGKGEKIVFAYEEEK